MKQDPPLAVVLAFVSALAIGRGDRQPAGFAFGFGSHSSIYTSCSNEACPHHRHVFQRQEDRRLSTSHVCFAKKKPTKKTKKTRASDGGSAGGGGFGASVAVKAPTDDDSARFQQGDYSVFPRLEARVLETLVPTSAAMDPEGGGALPEEVRHRLDQIYGLSNFNVDPRAATASDHAAPEESLADMLTFAGPAGSSSHSPSAELTPSAVWNAIPAFTHFRVLHVDPLVLAVDDFLTPEECDSFVDRSTALRGGATQARSPTVGKDAAAQAQRTSTTWYHHFSGVPELVAKATRLLGLDGIEHWEEPQTVRYCRNEKFTWHLDALGPAESQQELGGQRIATLLVYLTSLDLSDGGATLFRDLRGPDGSNGCLRVQPRKGTALLFFPSAGGIPSAPFDIRTLHCGEMVASTANQDKWIAQLWLRHGAYKPSAPPGNDHGMASQAISDYCSLFQ